MYLSPEYANNTGVKSLPMASLLTMILMETAFMERIYLLIRDTDMKVLEACYTVQERISPLGLLLRRMIAGGRLYNYCEHADNAL